MDTDAGAHQFVFVSGLYGSGASRVTSMLSNHRLVSMRRATRRPGHKDEDVRRVFDATATDNWALFPGMHLTEEWPECRPENAEVLWRSWAPYWDLSKPVLVERSAPNLMTARFLQGLFPDSYFVMVMRHPIAVVEAGRARSSSSRSSRLEHWVGVHEMMAEDLPHLDHVIVVRYEDLRTNAEDEYRRMLEFLELPWAPTVTELDLGSNEAYYHSFAAGPPWARVSTRKVVSNFGPRVERFGYLLRPPYVTATAELGILASRTPDRAHEPAVEAPASTAPAAGTTPGAGRAPTSPAPTPWPAPAVRVTPAPPPVPAARQAPTSPSPASGPPPAPTAWPAPAASVLPNATPPLKTSAARKSSAAMRSSVARKASPKPTTAAALRASAPRTTKAPHNARTTRQAKAPPVLKASAPRTTKAPLKASGRRKTKAVPTGPVATNGMPDPPRAH